MSRNGNLGDPASDAAIVTPNDSAGISAPFALYIGGAGDLRVTMIDGTDVTFTAVTSGSILPIRVNKVWSTSTTATGIVALY